MPTISVFYVIRMYFNDHAPPHFHARYGDFEATVNLGTLEIIEGRLPRRGLTLVQEWAKLLQEELLANGSVAGNICANRNRAATMKATLCTGT